MTRRFFAVTMALVPLAQAATSDDLKLTLAALTTEAAPGMPVTLRVTIEARKGDIPDVPAVSAESGNFELWLLRLTTGERTQYNGPGWNTTEAAPPSSKITPKQPAVRDLPVALPPGRYQLNIQYKGLGPDAPLYGQTSLYVHEPADAAETAWWKAIEADPALGEALQRYDFTGREKAASAAEALMESHLAAPHASPAGLALGKLCLTARKDPEKALQYLRTGARPTADPAIRARALFEASKALSALGIASEAESVLKQAAAQAKDSILLREIEERQKAMPAVPPPPPLKN